MMVRDRDDGIISEKKDTYVYPEIQSSQKMDYKPISSQINLDAKTRGSAQTIRDRLANQYKAYRFRNNQEFFRKSLKVDPLIRNIGDKIADDHNDKYRAFQTDVPKTVFDYVRETVGIRKLNGILRFHPLNTGKLLIDTSKIIQDARFLSICTHNDKLHITLHILTS
jgi:hypothetical protein